MTHPMPRVRFSRIRRRVRAAILLAVASLFALPSARAQEDPAGLSAVLIPLMIIGRPFYELHAIFSGEAANRSANRAFNEQRRLLYLASRPPIPVHGLYVGRVPMQRVLKDTLSYLAIPFVEMDSASAQWLVTGSGKPEDADRAMQQHPYVRVALAEQGDARCAQGSAPDRDWAQQFPLPARRCLAMEPVDELASDVELRLDASRIADRHLEWQLIDRGDRAVKFVSPFWSAYPENKGSGENTIEFGFQNSDYSNPLTLALEQLSPVLTARDARGEPMALRWVTAHRQSLRPSNFKQFSIVLGEARPAPPWTPESRQTWQEQVDEAYASRAGSVVRGRVVMPDRDVAMAPRWGQYTDKFVIGSDAYEVDWVDNGIFVTRYGADSLPAAGLLLLADKAPQPVLCGEMERTSCSVSVRVSSVSAETIALDLRAWGRAPAQAKSYPLSAPAAWLRDELGGSAGPVSTHQP